MTGATGYIGGRLAPRLLAAGHEVRCLSRSAARLRDVPWADSVSLIQGDLSDFTSLKKAFDGIEVAYFLVHSLGQPDFEQLDRQAATNFARAAANAGVARIIYLGGPEPPASDRPSPHLRSRAEAARILLDGPVPAIVLRAPVIIGSGSASFEMLRYLTERLPFMVTPRWVHNRIQPIAVRDVLRYLVAAAGFPADDHGATPRFPADDHVAAPGFPADVNRGFDIGGADVLTYAEMMRRYARVAGLRRRVIVPLRPLSPWLSAHWVGAVTPVPNKIARPLVASLVHEAITHEHDIARYVPDIISSQYASPAGPSPSVTPTRKPEPAVPAALAPSGLSLAESAARFAAPKDGLISGGGGLEKSPLGFDCAVQLALNRVRDADVETRWSTATAWDAAAEPLPTDPDWSGGTVYTDDRTLPVAAPAAALWHVIEGIGGENGWYSFPLAWSVRGWLDRMAGGIGLRRGRRDRHRLRVGEALDWWRVEEIIPGRLLRLRAEMRLPGRAWLEMYADPDGDGRSVYRQRAVFLPRGLAGHAYWASVLPFHGFVFRGMSHNITRAAEL